MNLPEGLPAWAYIVVSALVLAAQIVTAIWINHRGDERDRATRGEIPRAAVARRPRRQEPAHIGRHRIIARHGRRSA